MAKQNSQCGDFDFDAFSHMSISEREKYLEKLRQDEEVAEVPSSSFCVFDFGPLLFRSVDVDVVGK